MLKSRFNLKTVETNEDLQEEEKRAEEVVKEERKSKAQKREQEGSVKDEEDEAEQVGEATPTTEADHGYYEHPPPLVRILHRSEISVRLSMIGKTGDGDSYSYLKVACTEMKLTDISAIKWFKHLQFVNVSKNLITSAALQTVMELPFLVLLQADSNLLDSAYLKKGKFLQVLMMNHNHIMSVYDVFHPHLTTLEVGYNKIEQVIFKSKLPELKCLNLKENLIKDISAFEFANLVNIYLAGNQIKSLIGLEKMPNLKVLHVRNNPIKILDGFTATLNKLQYVNLRNCKVAKLFQIKKLRVLTALDTLIIKNCPLMGGSGTEVPKSEEAEEDPALRIEVVAALIQLKRLNKQNVTPEERTEAKEMKQWMDDDKDQEEELEEEAIMEEQNEGPEEETED